MTTIYCANEPCETEATMITSHGTPLCKTCAQAYGWGQASPDAKLESLSNYTGKVAGSNPSIGHMTVTLTAADLEEYDWPADKVMVEAGTRILIDPQPDTDGYHSAVVPATDGQEEFYFTVRADQFTLEPITVQPNFYDRWSANELASARAGN